MENEELNKKFEQHLNVDFPLLRERVGNLENRQEKVFGVQEKVQTLEIKMESMSCKVDSLGEKVDSFTAEMRKEFQNFTNTVRETNTSFIRWLIGTVLISLMLGLFFQYRAFHNVHKSIYELEKKLISAPKIDTSKCTP